MIEERDPEGLKNRRLAPILEHFRCRVPGFLFAPIFVVT
jgi:hypothetical protein